MTHYSHPIYRWDGLSPLAAAAVWQDMVEQIDAARCQALKNAMPETDEDRRRRMDATPDTPAVVEGRA